MWIILFLLLLATPAVAQTAPPVGTWTTIPKTAIFPVMPPEMSTCPGSGCVPELWSPASAFAYSGGDLYQWNGVWGMLLWGGGHAATADNSLYWSPFDGSGPKRLSGPYLAPDGQYGNLLPDAELYPGRSRNQDPSIAPGLAPKSRHTYGSLLTVVKNGKPYLWVYGGSLHVGSGNGTGVTRMFDLSQTYAQAMARPDMGWEKMRTAPGGSVTSTSIYDTTKNRVVTRGAHNLMVYDVAADTWTDRTPYGYNGCCDYPAGGAADLEGRKFYVFGDRIAEQYDLDSFAYTDLCATKSWAKPFCTPYWSGGYGEGPGMVWHARTKQLLFAGRKIAPDGQNGLPPEFFLIKPATGTVKPVAMPTTPFANTDGPWYSRFRLIPGTDQVVLMRTVTDAAVIGTIPWDTVVVDPVPPPVVPVTSVPPASPTTEVVSGLGEAPATQHAVYGDPQWTPGATRAASAGHPLLQLRHAATGTGTVS